MRYGASKAKRVLWIATLALGVMLPGARNADAATLYLNPSNAFATTIYNGEIDTAAEWFAYLGITPEPTLLYKSEVNGTTGLGLDEEAPYASSYKTTFSNSFTDPSAALIDYVSGSSIGCAACYLLVKGGATDPAQYLFRLSDFGWNGTDDISLSNFWPNQGAISNVGIYAEVPEPATLSLLALGLAGAGAARRRRARA